MQSLNYVTRTASLKWLSNPLCVADQHAISLTEPFVLQKCFPLRRLPTLLPLISPLSLASASNFHATCHSLTPTSLCCWPSGCHAESFPCQRKTLQTVKELQGNFMCWKGSKGYSPYTSLCPHYRQVFIYLFIFTWNKTKQKQSITHLMRDIRALLGSSPFK